ncbi:hypothetical protein CB1_000750002 [Camelus ferus]|nr:hypothetical protein CB1_000750002 [Camelus ferus]
MSMCMCLCVVGAGEKGRGELTPGDVLLRLANIQQQTLPRLSVALAPVELPHVEAGDGLSSSQQAMIQEEQ